MIQKAIKEIRSTLPEHVTLVVVSKTKPAEAIMQAYEIGERNFGENKVQELLAKYESLPKDVNWHYIGHLQTNKVKYVAPFIHVIHGCDSLKLLKEINKEASKNSRIISCLLQFHIATEETKFGLNFQEAQEILEHPDFKLLQNIQIAGVMGMATYTNNTTQIEAEFKELHTIFVKLQEKYFVNNQNFKELSMGMSGDYTIAISQGSTLIRVGSTIFGER